MIVVFKKKFERFPHSWKKGDEANVIPSFAEELKKAGIAVIKSEIRAKKPAMPSEDETEA